MKTLPPHQAGFSAVEALLTLFIAAMFITIFSQLKILIVQTNASVTQTSIASSLAYSKLREITTKPTGFVCNSNSDLSINAAAPGWQVSSGSLTGTGLPKPVTATVLAFAPRGCATGQPILINATIQYGSNPVKKVSHATYVPG